MKGSISRRHQISVAGDVSDAGLKLFCGKVKVFGNFRESPRLSDKMSGGEWRSASARSGGVGVRVGLERSHLFSLGKPAKRDRTGHADARPDGSLSKIRSTNRFGGKERVCHDNS